MVPGIADSIEMFEKDLWCEWTQYGGEVAGDEGVADRDDVAVSRSSLVAPAAAAALPGVVPSWPGRERGADGSIHLRVSDHDREDRSCRVRQGLREEEESLGFGAATRGVACGYTALEKDEYGARQPLAITAPSRFPAFGLFCQRPVGPAVSKAPIIIVPLGNAALLHSNTTHCTPRASCGIKLPSLWRRSRPWFGSMDLTELRGWCSCSGMAFSGSVSGDGRQGHPRMFKINTGAPWSLSLVSSRSRSRVSYLSKGPFSLVFTTLQLRLHLTLAATRFVLRY